MHVGYAMGTASAAAFLARQFIWSARAPISDSRVGRAARASQHLTGRLLCLSWCKPVMQRRSSTSGSLCRTPARRALCMPTRLCPMAGAAGVLRGVLGTGSVTLASGVSTPCVTLINRVGSHVRPEPSDMHRTIAYCEQRVQAVEPPCCCVAGVERRIRYAELTRSTKRSAVLRHVGSHRDSVALLPRIIHCAMQHLEEASVDSDRGTQSSEAGLPTEL
jgi:hypothetical protein